MQKPKHHIFVCAGFRMGTEAQGGCGKKGAADKLLYIESELADRGMADVAVSSTGCMRVCDKSPVMIVYPENYWYGEVDSEDKIDEILDALEEGEAVEEYLIC